MPIFGSALRFKKMVTPSTPSADEVALYFKSDGVAYVKSSDGVERPLSPKPDQMHLNPTFNITSLSTAGNSVTGSFPERLIPTSWAYFWASGSSGSAKYSADSVITLDGTGASLKIELPVSGDSQRAQSSVWSVPPNSIVSVAAWVRSTGPHVHLGLMSGSVETPDFFAGDSIHQVSANIVPTTTWQKINASFTVPAGHTKARITMNAAAGFSVPGSVVGNVWFDNTESSVSITPNAPVLPGTIIMWPTATAPDGYFNCAGGTFSSVTDPALATILGDIYGTHVGTTYYLPDFRARSPVGIGGVAAPALQGAYSFVVGQKFGEHQHLLTSAESGLPAHNHTGTSGNDSPDHIHASHAGTVHNVGSGGNLGTAGSYNQAALGGGGANTRHTHTIPTQTAANAVSYHNVTPAVLGINFIIKR